MRTAWIRPRGTVSAASDSRPDRIRIPSGASATVKDHSVEIRRHAVSCHRYEQREQATATGDEHRPLGRAQHSQSDHAAKLTGIAPVRQPAAINLPFGTAARRCSGWRRHGLVQTVGDRQQSRLAHGRVVCSGDSTSRASPREAPPVLTRTSARPRTRAKKGSTRSTAWARESGTCSDWRRISPLSTRKVSPSTRHRVTAQETTPARATNATTARSDRERLPRPGRAAAETSTTRMPNSDGPIRTTGERGWNRCQVRGRCWGKAGSYSCSAGLPEQGQLFSQPSPPPRRRAPADARRSRRRQCEGARLRWPNRRSMRPAVTSTNCMRP